MPSFPTTMMRCILSCGQTESLPPDAMQGSDNQTAEDNSNPNTQHSGMVETEASSVVPVISAQVSICSTQPIDLGEATTMAETSHKIERNSIGCRSPEKLCKILDLHGALRQENDSASKSEASAAQDSEADAYMLLSRKSAVDPVGIRLSFFSARNHSTSGQCRWPDASCSSDGRVALLVLESLGLNGTATHPNQLPSPSTYSFSFGSALSFSSSLNLIPAVSFGSSASQSSFGFATLTTSTGVKMPSLNSSGKADPTQRPQAVRRNVAKQSEPNLKRLEGVVQKFDKVSAESSYTTVDHTYSGLKTAIDQALLHTPYGQAMKHNTQFSVENFALDLLMDSSGPYQGLIALNMEDGTDLYRNISLLDIVEHGGKGKANLLQYVYEEEMTEEFDPKLWICVSTSFKVKGHWSQHFPEGASLEVEWNAKFAEYEKKYAAERKAITSGESHAGWKKVRPTYTSEGNPDITRNLFQQYITTLAFARPDFLGGSTDPASSNMILLESLVDFQKTIPEERNNENKIFDPGICLLQPLCQ